MTDRAIEILRWFLLASVVMNVLQATILFGFFQRRVFQPWYALSERKGGRVPTIMRDERMHRFWPLFMAVFCLVVWWYFGTPSGVEFLHKAMR
jgi:hypothetical protein